MRVVIAAVGRLKQGPERELAASYRKRAEATGRAFGLREIEVIEIRESRASGRGAAAGRGIDRDRQHHPGWRRRHRSRWARRKSR